MITLLFYMTVKPGREDEFTGIARAMMASTHAEDEGCINYSIHRQSDNPREFVLYEQWRDQAAVTAHLNRLLAANGRDRFMAFFESTRAVRYDSLT
jgi:quinol monooxygenase YgiN